jgi:FkbM family methyltransferase
MSLPDEPVRHQSFKNRIKSWISHSLFDNITYTVRRGPIKGMRRKGGLAWIPDWLVKDRETAEQRLFTQLNLEDKVVFDLGAFEGLTTLFFARRARRVVSYEPNPRNAARLLHNLKLNGVHNVTVRQSAVGATSGTAEIAWCGTRPGFSKIDDTPSGDQAVEQKTVPVTTLDLDWRQEGLPLPDLIKIDVEGYERAVLEGAREIIERHHPVLYIEMHGETMAAKRSNARRVIELLSAYGYGSILHVESGAEVTPETAEIAVRGHLYTGATARPAKAEVP